MSSPSKKALAAFTNQVWSYYRQHGRHDLLWRKPLHLKPYNILVSEVMLQQTQVSRVVPKYRMFLKEWPTARRLAAAPLRDVLRAWQGLGYNRRAKLLHECVKQVTEEARGRFPNTHEALQGLPGVGPYTAGAVMAFAYNQPVTMIETNIRTAFLHHFFHDETHVPDAEILQLAGVVCEVKRPREWYWALMDYGAHIKKIHGSQNERSKHYVKQSTFAGSDREIRGAIIRTLAEQSCTRRSLAKVLSQFSSDRINQQLQRLTVEGMIVKVKSRYQLPV